MMAGPRNLVETARRAILQRYPDMDGMRCSTEQAPVAGRYIVTAQKMARTADGRALQRIVRVTLDDAGHILKLSSSK